MDTTSTITSSSSTTVALPEIDHLLATLGSVTPASLTACPGWTAHDLVVHLVAGGAEMLRLIDDRLEGRPVSATTPFADREDALRDVAWDDLSSMLSGTALTEAIDRLGTNEPVRFTGWDMDAPTLRRHIRSELAVHRWDLAGSDDASLELLAQPDLTEHAASALTSFHVIDERAAARTWRSSPSWPLHVRLRAPGHDDVVLDVSGSSTTLRLEPPDDGPGIETDAAARLLMLWGRRPPQERHQLSTDLVPTELRGLSRWLYG